MASAAAISRRAPGFVQTDGTYFSLDGYKYTVVGANAYWISQAGLSDADMDKSFADIASMGATTVRVWGFNEMAEEHIAENGIYYQLWRGNKAVVNYSASGLGYFDRVIASARKHNLRLIVVLTSNYNLDWVVGGAGTYMDQVLGPNRRQTNDAFFTHPEIKDIFKNYVSAIVSRYKDEKTIMSWELGHQLKCAVSWNPRNPQCNPEIITEWIKEMSSHIKSIDSNHLVAVGDEGFFNRPNSNGRYVYTGRDGMDFEANSALNTIDYATFAYRPASYEMPTHSKEPLEWIDAHGKSQERLQKPVLLVDLGSEIRPHWLDQIVESGIAGTLYWQAGTEGIKLNMPYWFRGDYISLSSDIAKDIKKHFEALKRRP
ncbi:CEL4b mannanase [Coprinopsis cinerea AmutBmut pab1-1]|nr:CEL4b mannanase [Coprinopsis cinerea AmutBmut pab1-1]